MDEGQSLEGWEPEPSETLPLARIIDLAFDYRGNTTVVKVDGTGVDGYVFDRNPEGPEPYLQMFDADGGGPIRIRYADVRTVRFTGKDTATGNSYTAWLRRREQEKAGKTPSERAHDDHASSRC